MLALIGGI